MPNVLEATTRVQNELDQKKKKKGNRQEIN